MNSSLLLPLSNREFTRTLPLTGLVCAIPVAALALLAAGLIGKVGLTGAPVDRALVLSTLWHSLLGCVLVWLQWGAGAGLARWTNRGPLPLTSLLLLGYPFSLILILAASCLAIAVPYGQWFAAGLLLLCFGSFARNPLQWHEIRDLLRLVFTLLPGSVLLGCWMGFLAHGPTATVPGVPSGDVGYYASTIVAFQAHAFPPLSLANEGEYLMVFNLLHSILGAALMGFIPLDPFQFVLSSGGSMYVMGFGIALYAWLVSLRISLTPFASLLLVLAAVVAARYPYWVVESPPVIAAIPLTICIWYRASDPNLSAISRNFAFSIVGSALSKVTSALSLATISVVPILTNPAESFWQFRRLPVVFQTLAIVAAAATLIYVVHMLADYGPATVTAGGVGPESYIWRVSYNERWRTVFPFLLRDIGTGLLGIVSFRIFAPLVSAALCAVLASTLLFPFFMRINLDCVLIIVVLALAGGALPSRKWRWFTLGTYLLFLPAIIQTEYGGHPSSAIWLLSIGSMPLAVISSLPANHQRPRLLVPRSGAMGALTLAAATALFLVAIARQEVIYEAPNKYLLLTSEVRDIWAAVRQNVPPAALVFTDQTGTEPTSLRGWNTIATTGQRQVYLAGWYQTGELRFAPDRLADRLRTNEAVLSGQTRPAELKYRRGPYTGYFAVVSGDRPMPSVWQPVYRNRLYTLYRYETPPAPAEVHRGQL